MIYNVCKNNGFSVKNEIRCIFPYLIHMEYTVYAKISPPEWSLSFMYKDEPVTVNGEENQETPLRNELQAMLEILQFLRKWVTEPATFVIYVNSQYCITCVDKWIPLWIQKGFRIANTASMRPNTDLLVKLHSFGQCMKFDLIQHYDDYDTFQSHFN